jgi:hypothetical protein
MRYSQMLGCITQTGWDGINKREGLLRMETGKIQQRQVRWRELNAKL